MVNMTSISAGEYADNLRDSGDVVGASRVDQVRSWAAGRTVEIFDSEGSTNALGFVHRQGDSPVYIRADVATGEDREIAQHTVEHEVSHLETLREIELPEGFVRMHEDVIVRSLRGIPGVEDIITETELIEGFNELLVIRKLGEDERIAYTHKEVKMAERLEELTQKYLGFSLADAFEQGAVREFGILLHRLANAMLMHRYLESQGDIGVETEKRVSARIRDFDGNFTTPKEVENVVDEMIHISVGETLGITSISSRQKTIMYSN